jgi:hypothetical protein
MVQERAILARTVRRVGTQCMAPSHPSVVDRRVADIFVIFETVDMLTFSASMDCSIYVLSLVNIAQRSQGSGSFITHTSTTMARNVGAGPCFSRWYSVVGVGVDVAFMFQQWDESDVVMEDSDNIRSETIICHPLHSTTSTDLFENYMDDFAIILSVGPVRSILSIGICLL